MSPTRCQMRRRRNQGLVPCKARAGRKAGVREEQSPGAAPAGRAVEGPLRTRRGLCELRNAARSGLPRSPVGRQTQAQRPVKNCQALPRSYEEENRENFAESAVATFADVHGLPAACRGLGGGRWTGTAVPQGITSGFVSPGMTKTMGGGVPGPWVPLLEAGTPRPKGLPFADPPAGQQTSGKICAPR